LTDADGKPRISHGKYTTVWKKQPDGSFITAQAKANFKKNPRDERDAAFNDDENVTRHDQLRIRSRYNAAQVSRKAAGQK